MAEIYGFKSTASEGTAGAVLSYEVEKSIFV